MSGRVEALEKIATGGTATVFVGAREIERGVRSLVAVKRLHPHLCEDAREREALLEEARLLARVRHPHVVGLHDVRVEADRVELVIDYVEGASLSELLVSAARADGRLAVGVVIRILLDACAGLAAIHTAVDESGAPLGIVHRDVSPQNILVGVDGFARIADLGTAKVHTRDRTATTVGTLKGKLGYMAPEYVASGTCDRRVDVFALGVVTWEALAARRLFRGSNEGETLRKIEHEPAPAVSTVAPEVPPALDAVVARALEKRPDQRYADMDAFARALREAAGSDFDDREAVSRAVRALAGEKIAERRTLQESALARAGTEERTVTLALGRPAAKHRTVLVAVSGAAIAGLGALAVYVSSTRSNEASGPLDAHREVVTTAAPSPTSGTEPTDPTPTDGTDGTDTSLPEPVASASAAPTIRPAARPPTISTTPSPPATSAQRPRPPPNPY